MTMIWGNLILAIVFMTVCEKMVNGDELYVFKHFAYKDLGFR